MTTKTKDLMRVREALEVASSHYNKTCASREALQMLSALDILDNLIAAEQPVDSSAIEQIGLAVRLAYIYYGNRDTKTEQQAFVEIEKAHKVLSALDTLPKRESIVQQHEVDLEVCARALCDESFGSPLMWEKDEFIRIHSRNVARAVLTAAGVKWRG